MRRAAIYARYSSDELQSDRSIDDQVALCRAYAAREELVVVAVFEDHGLSGAGLANRPGVQSLLAAAAARQFDVVIAETTSRLSRDQEDRAHIRKRLAFADVAVMTPNRGLVTHLTDGIEAVVDSEQLESLKIATRRGMAGLVRDGLSAGGRAYGYDVLPPRLVRGRKEPLRGERAVNAAEAAIVRRIFAEYVAGRLPREICRDLNREGIKPPRGIDWRPSTLIGNARRGCGLLRNELHVGRLVWNRVRMVKDPDTQRRVSRPNPPDRWQRVEVPALRIVDDETFAKAAALIAARGQAKPMQRRRPRRMLSGLLRCGCCGGSMALRASGKHTQRIECTRAKDAGTCDNRRSFAIAPIEARVVATLRAHLADPRAIERFLATYQAERKRLAKAESTRRAAAERRLGAVKREIERAMQSLVKGLAPIEEAGATVTALHHEKKRLQAELATEPETIVSLHPVAVKRYLAAVDALAQTLQQAEFSRSTTALRELVEAVIVSPKENAPPEIEIRGRLAALAGADLFPQCTVSGCKTVAGAGLRLAPTPKTALFSLWAA